MSDITKNLLLLSVQFSLPQQTKKDRERTAEVITAHGATADSGSWNTSLWPKGILDPIVSAQGKVRNYCRWRCFTSPFPSTWILHAKDYFNVAQGVAEGVKAVESAVATVAADLLQHVHAAKQSRNGLFREELYPKTPQEFINKCHSSIEFHPYGQPTQFDAMRLAVDEIEHLKAQFEQQTNELVKQATMELRQKILQPLRHMASTLSDGEKTRWHRSLIGNVQDIVEATAGMNIADDPIGQRAADEIGKLLSGISYESLKENESLRGEVGKKAADIANRLAAYV